MIKNMKDKEIWKLVDTKKVKVFKYEKIRKYYVSNLGRCKIDNKIVEFKPRKKEEITGYYVFHNKRVHRWVAELFIINPNNYPCIDHIDTNIHNNRVDNLRWVDVKGNCNNELTKKHQSEAQLKLGIHSERAKKQWQEKRDIMIQAANECKERRLNAVRTAMKTQKYHDNMSAALKGRKRYTWWDEDGNKHWKYIS